MVDYGYIHCRKLYLKVQLLTTVSRNGEKCGKFTFFFRKKCYLIGKLSGYEVRHFLKPQNVIIAFFWNLGCTVIYGFIVDLNIYFTID